MGMFDWVTYTAPCHFCGAKIGQWQTKSTKDGDLFLRDVQPKDTENFYGDCIKCHQWNEYNVTESGEFEWYDNPYFNSPTH